jgi:hypothetical protein
MYFSTSQYPELRGKARPEQRRIVTAASRKFDRWASQRFWFVVSLLLNTAYASRYFLPSQLVAELGGWPVPASCALAFYVYLLWDINGPALKAVHAYASEGSIA